MARKTKKEAEETRKAILDAAEQVFLSRGISRASLEEIATKAGVTRGAVYWHFKNKLDLYDTITRRVFLPHEKMLQALASEPTSSPIDDLKNVALQSLRQVQANKKKRDIFSLLFLHCEKTEETARIIKRRNEGLDHTLVLTRNLFTRARDLGMLDPEWTPLMAAIAAQTLIIGLISSALEKREGFGLTTICIDCVEVFFNSLKNGTEAS